MVAQTNSSVIRAFQILQLFLDGRPEGTAPAVTAALDTNGITAHRFLKTLETTDALVPVGRGTYRLGFALADLGMRAASPDSLVTVIQPVLDQLAAATREGAMAATFDGDMVICRARNARPLTEFKAHPLIRHWIITFAEDRASFFPNRPYAIPRYPLALPKLGMTLVSQRLRKIEHDDSTGHLAE